MAGAHTSAGNTMLAQLIVYIQDAVYSDFTDRQLHICPVDQLSRAGNLRGLYCIMKYRLYQYSPPLEIYMPVTYTQS